MKEHLLNKYGIKQLGFYVENIEVAAKAFADMLGAGPFFDLGSQPPKFMEYRGRKSDVIMRCALGQLGEMQIELIELDTDEPNVYDDMGGYGLHHLCIWTDDYDGSVEKLKAEGFEEAMRIESMDGRKVSYFDCRAALGVFLEVNAPSEQLWVAVKAKSQTWDGIEPLLSISDLMG